jgi:hypothetical protein
MPPDEVIEHLRLKLSQMSLGPGSRNAPAGISSLPVSRRTELDEAIAKSAHCSSEFASARSNHEYVFNRFF